MYGGSSPLQSADPLTDAELALEFLQDLGLADRLPELARRVEAAQKVAAHTVERENVGAQRARLQADVIAGRLSAEDAATRLHEATARDQVAGTAEEFHTTAVKTASNAAWKVLTDATDSLVTDILTPAAERCIQAAREAVAELPEEITPEQAARARGKVRTAWRTLEESAATWRNLTRAAAFLRRRGAIPVSREVRLETDDDELFHIGQPWNVTPEMPDVLDPGPAGLAALVRADTAPGVYTSTQVQEIWRVWDEKKRKAAEVPVRGSAMHDPTPEEWEALLARAGIPNGGKDVFMESHAEQRRHAG